MKAAAGNGRSGRRLFLRAWTRNFCTGGTSQQQQQQQQAAVFARRSGLQQNHRGLSLGEAVDRLENGRSVTPSAYALLIRQCIKARSLPHGRRVHAHLARGGDGGHHQTAFLGNLLVQLYARCGHLEEARSVFDGLRERNVISWTSMMGAYVQHGHFRGALELYHSILKANSSVVADAFVFTVALAACSNLGDLSEGRAIHARCIGCKSDVVLETALVNMYAKCGSLDEAKQVFDAMQVRDSVSWNAIISAYAQNGHIKPAMDLYLQMAAQGVEPSDVTFLSVLGICSSLDETRAIHARVLASGIQSSEIPTSLVSAYARCGSLADARRVFDEAQQRTLFLWTALIAAYAHHGHSRAALDLFDRMCSEGVDPDCYTYSIALLVCANTEALEEGMAVHGRIIASRIQHDNTLVAALVNMYAKCGSLADAKNVFDRIPRRCVVVWNAMLAGFVQHEQGREALELYEKMCNEAGLEPSTFTFSTVLCACASLEALQEGKAIHAQVVARGLDSDNVVQNSLVTMYAKCGSLEDALRVFEKTQQWDVMAWNAIIVAFARYGHGWKAIELYLRMQLEGVEPNDITLKSVLTACGHTGLLSQCHSYFTSMVADHGIVPGLEHYECVIDMLGRSGRLEDADSLMGTMPFQPGAAAWRSLLGACRVHNNNVDIAKRAAEHVVKLDPKDHTAYVLLSNVYTGEEQWNPPANEPNGELKDEVSEVKDELRLTERGVCMPSSSI